MRVVSLLPSATEIVYALDHEPVATSHECDYPPPAAEKPAVNRSRIDSDASSAEINTQVLEAERAGGVYEIDLEALDRADPDIVISQGICDVCAVDTVLVEEALDELGLEAEVLTTDPHSVSDVFADIERIGGALGAEDRATELLADLRARLDRVKGRVAEVRKDNETPPRVAVLDWMDPPMVAGHWVPEMVEWAGGTYGLADPGARSDVVPWARIRDYDPDVLIAAPCGFDLEQTRANRADLTDRPGWQELTAVQEGRAYAMDGHDYMNRPGPRLVDTLEHLAALVTPEAFPSLPPSSAVVPLPQDPVEV